MNRLAALEKILTQIVNEDNIAMQVVIDEFLSIKDSPDYIRKLREMDSKYTIVNKGIGKTLSQYVIDKAAERGDFICMCPEDKKLKTPENSIFQGAWIECKLPENYLNITSKACPDCKDAYLDKFLDDTFIKYLGEQGLTKEDFIQLTRR